MEKDIEFLKRRLEISQKENETLKKENQVIKQELASCKSVIRQIAEKKSERMMGKSQYFDAKTEEELRIVLDFQSQRIRFLEDELDRSHVKYEKKLFNTETPELGVRPLSSQISDQFNTTYQMKKNAQDNQDEMQKITQGYAREIASLKQKIAKQDAELIISGIYSNNNSKQQPEILRQQTPIGIHNNSNNLSSNNLVLSDIKRNSLLQNQQQLSSSLNTVQRPSSIHKSTKSINSQFENKFGHLYTNTSVLEDNSRSQKILENSFQTPQQNSNGVNLQTKQHANRILDSLESIQKVGNQQQQQGKLQVSRTKQNILSSIKQTPYKTGIYDDYINKVSKQNI